MHDQSLLKACFWSWKAYVSCLTCFDVSQHSFQLFNADFDFVLRFLLYNFVCFLSFVFVVQFVVVVGSVPATKTRFTCQLPTMGSTCLHWSLSTFLQILPTPLEY